MNWNTRSIDVKSGQNKTIQITNTIRQLIYTLLIEYLKLLSSKLPTHYFYSCHPTSYALLHNIGLEVMRQTFCHTVEKRQSQKLIGQNGVFTKGDISKYQLVALYPGTIYLPMEPLLFISIANKYLLRCYDGIYVDGKNRGLSKYIYKSCAYRDKIGNYLCADLSWLSDSPVNPLNIGQYINNQSETLDANVEYYELNLSLGDLTLEMRRLLPYVYWNSIYYTDKISKFRTVCLVATRNILSGEELYSNYITVLKS